MSLRPEEWPEHETTLPRMNPFTIDSMIEHRERTGLVMIPSPLVEAHIRFSSGSSRHDIGVDGEMRESDASDFFGRNDQAEQMFASLIANPNFRGVGIYFDCEYKGKPQIMFHVDQRENRLWWIRINKKQYLYEPNDPVKFWRLLADEFEKWRQHT